MTSTMFRSVVLTVLMQNILVSPAGVLCLKPEDGAPVQALDLPWHDELCCDSHTTHVNVPETNRSESKLPHDPRCSFSSLTAETPREASDLKSSVNTGPCLDVMCRIDVNWETLTCDLKSQTSEDAGLMAVSFQRLLSQKDESLVNDGQTTSDNPVVCEAEDSLVCSVALDTTASFIAVVTVGISNAEAPPVQLRIPARPVKPSPPVNLSHVQTIEAELILLWDDPSDSGPLRYEVRHAFNSTHPAWQVVSVPAEPRLSLDLKPNLNYTLQARCSGPDEPPLWSDWSESHHIYLHTVSYIPEKVMIHAGEDVTVYCVFNNHSVNASTAIWVLNLHEPLHRSQYHPVNQRVSRITVRPSEARMYDLLQCTEKWTSPYSQIYVQGASIDINCVTNGDIDAMDCSWENTQWSEPKLQSRWADLPCDVMEERDRAGQEVGQEVGQMGPACLHVRSDQKSCTIQPLRMNCYKLWLEVASRLGPIRSKPVYLSPIDHVKPHTPTNVKAVSHSRGALLVTWEPPSLPVEGLQCQLQYHSPSMMRAQPEWKGQSPVRVAMAEVAVPDMCRVYVVQVRCMHTNGTGHWSEWSDAVYSAPQNSGAPERGPNFWRILQDDPYRNQTNVTLLFKDLPVSGRSYCVDGFIVQHQASSGAVTRERIEPASSYSFEWNQEPQTVTVAAYNSRGSSANNINMTLERQPKRRCVRSFGVSVVNSTSVSLSWTLLDNSSVPVFMVVQWTVPQRQHGSDHHKAQSGETWVRLPYTERPVHLRGDFFGSEEYGFYLYPVFADGEGEPIYTIATRGDPAAYMMLMIISFLSIVLFVTLILSQNQMKKFVWKDVPNPNKCSWAKGLDFKKNDTLEHLFGPSEALPNWSLLMPSENISKLVIMDKADLSALTSALVQTPLVPLTTDPSSALSISLPPEFDSEVDQGQFTESELLLGGAPSLALNLDALTSSYPRIEELQPGVSQPPGSTESSAQSSITYSTVLLSDPKQDQPSIHLQYKGGSGSSSSDEGNFSANNSDISGSFPGGLWELESCRGGEMDDPRRSCSYNSVEELSETSEQEDEGEGRGEKDLYYLGMDYPAEDEESEEEEELGKNVVLNREVCCVESRPLLGVEDSSGPMHPLSASTGGFSPLYLPQFRTATCTRQLQDSTTQL
ncbi:leptin receptor isoform X1 [Hippoglossus hippoglossus]|uniref:leptin receptor isoform X1 n=1 Tax=Hippoglossus hippoglossus TaxID=8267 RepID=UPI00148B6527|nr:leptin receptor isoform X1 [Hippoglossus hippoglossus]XP_034438999.1 leptin receptor isoform X1 [Hippoglossus hippoglossus]